MTEFLSPQVRAEHQKVKHTKALLVPLGFLGFYFLWTMWQISSMKPDEFRTGYTMLFYQLPVMNAILLPLMISVTASRICDMEVKGDTLKLLYTVQKPGSFFDCKYLNGFRYLVFFTFGQGLLILFFGSIKKFGGFRAGDFFLYLLTVLTVSAVILIIQQTLSLLSENQLFPLVIGIAGSFLGLFSMFFPAPVARFVLWGYYAVFSTVGMDWNKDTRIIHYYEIPFPTRKFILFLAFGIFVFLLCRIVFTKKEV